MQKLGGQPLDSVAQLQDCIAHARLRHKEVSLILRQQLEAADAAAAAAAPAGKLKPGKRSAMEMS